MNRFAMIGTFVAAGVLSLAAPPAARAQDDDPTTLRLAEPDFTLAALPTSLRVPKYRSAFRVTHRFTRPLNPGPGEDAGDVAADLFGIDGGAQIGLELRFGVLPNGQVGIHRTSNRTIEFFTEYRLLSQSTAMVDVSFLGAIEGTNNFKDSYSPTVGGIVSRTFADRAAVYVEPMWVNNTNQLPKELVDHNSTFQIGLGTRVRINSTVYVVVEAIPRASGYRPGVTQGTFAIEKRAGGHTFQLNFSNAVGTTMAQIARGGPAEKDWFMGFNISRKFF